MWSDQLLGTHALATDRIDPEEAVHAALRRLIERLSADDLARLDAVIARTAKGPTSDKRPWLRDVAPNADPAMIGVLATLRRFRSLAGSDRHALRLKGIRGLHFLERLIDARRVSAGPPRSAERTQTPTPSGEERAIQAVYRWAVGRTPQDWEVAEWTRNLSVGMTFSEFVNGMAGSEEANDFSADAGGNLSDGAFVQALHLAIEGRTPRAEEIDRRRQQLRSGASRERLALWLLRDRLREWASAPAEEAGNGENAAEVGILGTSRTVTREEWVRQRVEIGAKAAQGLEASDPPPVSWPCSGAEISDPSAETGIVVSAIAYAGPDAPSLLPALEAVLAASRARTPFELVLIEDPASEASSRRLGQLSARHAHVVHRRFDTEIGVAQALNAAIAAANGRYLTRIAADCIRHPDSLALQASTLDAIPFADVVYQDVYYAFEEGMPFEEAARVDVRSRVGHVTYHQLMRANLLRHAPMWRKSLHGDLGLLDADFGTAAELEFWFRCLKAGRTFYRRNEPLSVHCPPARAPSHREARRRDEEARRVSVRCCGAMMPAAVLDDIDDFRRSIGLPDPGDDEGSRYHIAQDRLRRLSVERNPARAARRPQAGQAS